MKMHPLIPPAEAEFESYIRETARRLGLKLDEADIPSVVSVFGELQRHADALMVYDLPEAVEAAAVFRIRAERSQ